MTTATPPTLVYDPNQGFRFWSISQIYNPNSNPLAKYVPNIDDLVLDYTAGFFRVTAVDATTGISVLIPWSPPPSSTANGLASILLGSAPGVQYESFRAYINQNVLPYSLALDSRLHLYGTTVSYIKVFLGTDISQNGTIISQWYDTSGNFLGENIPTELVANPDGNVLAIQAPKVGYTLSNLQDGEVVTVVTYTSDGQATSTAQLLVKNTTFVRTTDASLKYITAIAVETPFLSQTDSKLIQYPINMPVEQLNLIGVVTYSDGSQLRMPVDGTKFSMYGLNSFVATIQGQVVPLVLTYTLSAGEYTYLSTAGSNRFITENYRATTLQQNGAYSIKLFAYPVWQDPISGYRLDWWLYDLDRESVYNVTPYIQAAANSATFNPLLYGTQQNLTVAINMSQVDAKFANYRHVQTIAINLLTPGTEHQNNWSIQFAPGQSPLYGLGVKAELTFINQNDWQLDLSSGYLSLADWLNNLYFNTLPLFNTQSETVPPTPNFFALIIGGQRIEVPVSQWNQLLTVPGGIAEGQLVYLQFFQRTTQTDLQLSIAGVIVHYPSTSPTATTGTTARFTDTINARTVSYADASIPAANLHITAWAWDFGDASGTSTVQNPTYTYVNSGSYSVTLTITDSAGGTATFASAVQIA